MSADRKIGYRVFRIIKINIMLEELKQKVLLANQELVKRGLVIYTWGNASGIDRESRLVVIKPSGVDYAKLTVKDMVVVNLAGKTVEGNLKPSVDLPTHLALYNKFPQIGGVAHTHSTYATSFAQAGKNILAYGTTHADYFFGDIPCTRALTKNEIENEYELNTGKVIVETFCNNDIMAIPACLVKNHGVFAWGENAGEAVFNASVAEECAKTAYLTENINPNVKRVDQYLLDKHYDRKHGENATYGQNGEK